MTKRNVLLLTLFLGGFFWVGCKTTEIVGPSGETQAVYSWGTLKATENKPIAMVNASALRAMENLGLTVTMKTADSLSALIVARDSQDQKITVRLTSLAENSTRVVIQAGPLGDEEKSRIVYKQMQTSVTK